MSTHNLNKLVRFLDAIKVPPQGKRNEKTPSNSKSSSYMSTEYFLEQTAAVTSSITVPGQSLLG